MSLYRAHESAVAIGLSVVGLATGGWLLALAFRELITGCRPHDEAVLS